MSVGGIEIPVVWVGVDETPVQLVNEFVVQERKGDFVLTAGHLNQPILIGSPDEQQLQAMNVYQVSISVVERLSMSKQTLEELIGVLQLVASRGKELE